MRPDRQWFVVEMDRGVIRREPTKAAALAWAVGRAFSTNVLPGRRRQHDGFYEYLVGPDRYECEQIWIARGDAAARQGFEITETPLYPYENDPYELVERTTEGTSDD